MRLLFRYAERVRNDFTLFEGQWTTLRRGC